MIYMMVYMRTCHNRIHNRREIF